MYSKNKTLWFWKQSVFELFPDQQQLGTITASSIQRPCPEHRCDSNTDKATRTLRRQSDSLEVVRRCNLSVLMELDCEPEPNTPQTSAGHKEKLLIWLYDSK